VGHTIADPVPDPDLELSKCLAEFLLDIFLVEICSKKYIHEPKSKQERCLKYLWFFNTSKVDIRSFIRGHSSGSA
jgi:hypothetical protein